MVVGFTASVFNNVLRKLGEPLLYKLSQAQSEEIVSKASFMFLRRNGVERWVMNVDGIWDILLAKLPQPREGIIWVVDKIIYHQTNAFWKYSQGERAMLKGIAPFMDSDVLGPLVKIQEDGTVVSINEHAG